MLDALRGGDDSGVHDCLRAILLEQFAALFEQTLHSGAVLAARLHLQ